MPWPPAFSLAQGQARTVYIGGVYEKRSNGDITKYYAALV